RLWQHHFGTGIVATPDNLGVTGAAPSHPELLDWLAYEFASPPVVPPLGKGGEGGGAQPASGAALTAPPDPPSPPLLRGGATSGWSMKNIHRVILNSAAYRQIGRDDERGKLKDPDNRLLWRFPVRRLDAEAIRDALLAVSGDLDARLGGPAVGTKRN